MGEYVFSALYRKLDVVMKWPGLSSMFIPYDFEQAMDKAKNTGLVEKHRELKAADRTVDLVIVPYLENDHQTYLYLTDRIRETERGCRVTAGDQLVKSVDSVSTSPYCQIVVELIEFNTEYSPKRDGFPGDTLLAHAGILASVAQTLHWRGIPQDRSLALGGYVTTVYKGKPHSPEATVTSATPTLLTAKRFNPMILELVGGSLMALPPKEYVVPQLLKP